MSSEEEMAVRYAGGYIAMKLRKHFLKQTSTKAGNFVECLTHMAVDGEESSFLEYTKLWTTTVNRGGLFEIDATFLFFKAVEVRTQNILPHHLQHATQTRQKLVESIMEEEDVQTFWSMLSLDIRDDSQSQELLQEIVEMWVTMRGFSMTSFWMEQYKRVSHETTQKKTSLRKSLKKKNSKKL